MISFRILRRARLFRISSHVYTHLSLSLGVWLAWSYHEGYLRTLSRAGIQLNVSSEPQTIATTIVCGQYRAVPPGLYCLHEKVRDEMIVLRIFSLQGIGKYLEKLLLSGKLLNSSIVESVTKVEKVSPTVFGPGRRRFDGVRDKIGFCPH